MSSHYECTTWGVFILFLRPLLTASVWLWFLSLVLFNISLRCSGAGNPAPGSLSDMPLLIVPQHFINQHTSLEEEEIILGRRAQLQRNAQKKAWCRFDIGIVRKPKRDGMFGVVPFISECVTQVLWPLTSGILLVLCWMTVSSFISDLLIGVSMYWCGYKTIYSVWPLSDAHHWSPSLRLIIHVNILHIHRKSPIIFWLVKQDFDVISL